MINIAVWFNEHICRGQLDQDEVHINIMLFRTMNWSCSIIAIFVTFDRGMRA